MPVSASVIAGVAGAANPAFVFTGMKSAADPGEDRRRSAFREDRQRDRESYSPEGAS